MRDGALAGRLVQRGDVLRAGDQEAAPGAGVETGEAAVMTTLDYQTRAERHNRRTAKRFPLFAAGGVLDQVVKPWTGETVEAIHRDLDERLTAARREGYTKGALMRRQAAERMTRDELRERDRYFARVYPHKSEYFCEFWCKQLARLQEAERCQS